MAQSKMSLSKRLFKQNTVNSSIRVKYDNKCVVPDSLDLILSSIYNHENDLFVDKSKTVLQLENAPSNPTREKLIKEFNEFQQNYIHHPLFIGGISEKKSPHSVKLICIGQHTPITNPGFSRQPLDGNIFNFIDGNETEKK